MNILMLHNRYLIRGGEDESTQAEARLLREHGLTVDLFELSNAQVEALGPLRTGLGAIWSQATYQQVRRRLREGRYDILHVQNFFPLFSPSAHHAGRAEGVGVVQTLRNYRLLCPNAYLFRDSAPCEDCLGKPFAWPGVRRGCYRGSRSATLAVAAMSAAHRLLQTWQTQVDVLVALTEFARQKYIAGGLPTERLVVKPNFVDPDPGPGSGGGNFFLFVGRLSPEKGLSTLLAAWKNLGDPIALKIVGDGPLAEWVRTSADQIPGVEYLGRRPLGETQELMGQARALIFPSEWYETFGRVAIEAFARGTPVIAPHLGTMASLVTHGRTGLHYPPGNAQALAERVEWVLDHPAEWEQMRKAARAEYLAHYTGAANFRALLEIYERALSRRDAPVPARNDRQQNRATESRRPAPDLSK